MLIERGADVNKADDDGVTPLHIASQNGHKACVRLLVDGVADVKGSVNLWRFVGGPFCCAIPASRDALSTHTDSV